jgi:type IV pilus assembly protein PilM
LRVEPASPLANLVVRDGAFEGLVTDEVAPLMMLPIGLALRQPA